MLLIGSRNDRTLYFQHIQSTRRGDHRSDQQILDISTYLWWVAVITSTFHWCLLSHSEALFESTPVTLWKVLIDSCLDILALFGSKSKRTKQINFLVEPFRGFDHEFLGNPIITQQKRSKIYSQSPRRCRDHTRCIYRSSPSLLMEAQTMCYFVLTWLRSFGVFSHDEDSGRSILSLSSNIALQPLWTKRGFQLQC